MDFMYIFPSILKEKNITLDIKTNNNFLKVSQCQSTVLQIWKYEEKRTKI